MPGSKQGYFPKSQSIPLPRNIPIWSPVLLKSQSFSPSPSSLSINRYGRVRPGNSQMQQLTQGTRSLGFPAARLVHCRYSWNTEVIISSLLQPQLIPSLLLHLAFPLQGQVGETGCRGACCPWHFINIILLVLSSLYFRFYCLKSCLTLLFNLRFQW